MITPRFNLMIMLALSGSLFFTSCKEDDKEVKNCNDLAKEYNEKLKNYLELFGSEDEEESFSCDDIGDVKKSWAEVEAAYEKLCEESKTEETKEEYVEIASATEFMVALCDL